MACKMWFGFQFNLSDSSDDGLYRLDLDPEGQGHQWKMISIQLGSYFGAPKKKSSWGCLRVRPDANANADANADAEADANADTEADANRSKTICQPPLKGGRHNWLNLICLKILNIQMSLMQCKNSKIQNAINNIFLSCCILTWIVLYLALSLLLLACIT